MFILQKSKQCGNCDQLKERLQEQEEAHELKIRELETCIRDLTAEKEALKQKLKSERRSSEEFTNHVQLMVQRLETEQRTNKQEKGEAKGKLKASENFFYMVKRFFTEHEPLKDQAENCLRDLQQLQQYFQVGFIQRIHLFFGSLLT